MNHPGANRKFNPESIPWSQKSFTGGNPKKVDLSTIICKREEWGRWGYIAGLMIKKGFYLHQGLKDGAMAPA
jgi:hypothetical protein